MSQPLLFIVGELIITPADDAERHIRTPCDPLLEGKGNIFGMSFDFWYEFGCSIVLGGEGGRGGLWKHHQATCSEKKKNCQ